MSAEQEHAPSTTDEANALCTRIGRNPDVESIYKLRQQYLPLEQRETDRSAPQKFAASEKERDERERTRRDYRD